MRDYYTQRVSGTDHRHFAWPAIKQYVLYRIRHPVEGSPFDRATWWFRDWMPDSMLIWLLKFSGRDGILLMDESGVIAHAFFHRHWFSRTWVHLFHVEVRPDCRKQGLSEACCREFLLYLHDLPGVFRIQFSRGGTAVSVQNRNNVEAIIHIYEKIKAGKASLPKRIFVVTLPNFVLWFSVKEAKAKNKEVSR